VSVVTAPRRLEAGFSRPVFGRGKPGEDVAWVSVPREPGGAV